MTGRYVGLLDRQLPDSGFRLLVDCTQTMKTPVTTGIQRVVKNLIKHGFVAARSRKVELIPVRFNGQVFERVTLSREGELQLAVPGRAQWVDRVLLRLKKIFINRKVDRQLKKLYQYVYRDQLAKDRLEFRPQDVLLLPDSSWAEPMWQEIDLARSRGVLIGVLQHDFIPIRNPELVPTDSTEVFRRWLTESLSRADFVIAVSRTIAEECRFELRKLGREAVADDRVSVCRNGADFSGVGSSTQVRPELVSFVRASQGGPYLTIGTIEPRKNHGLLLDALDEVLRASPHERFLIAGIVGWRGKTIEDRIKRHDRYGKNILLVNDMSDSELAYAYQHAKAVVFPSLAEGFGLPIVEAITRGTRVFASNISVHQEIGSDYCVYFDPTDARQLAQVLIGYSQENRFAATWPPIGFKAPTWKEAAETFVATSLLHARKLNQSAIRSRPESENSRFSFDRKAS